MSHIFNPANPTLTIQSGLQYFIGRAGLCTQLSPIFAGQGTGGGNPAANSPGQPNTGSAGSGPYTPIFPPFPGGFTTPGLKTFTIVAQNDVTYGVGYGLAGFPNTTETFGTLSSGGGVGGLAINVFIAELSGGFLLQLQALKSLFASNPFTSFNQYYNSLSWNGNSGPVTVPASNTGFSVSSNGTYWGATWSTNGSTSGFTAGHTYTVTVA